MLSPGKRSRSQPRDPKGFNHTGTAAKGQAFRYTRISTMPCQDGSLAHTWSGYWYPMPTTADCLLFTLTVWIHFFMLNIYFQYKHLKPETLQNFKVICGDMAPQSKPGQESPCMKVQCVRLSPRCLRHVNSVCRAGSHSEELRICRCLKSKTLWY